MAQIAHDRGDPAEIGNDAAVFGPPYHRLQRTDQSLLLLCALATVGVCTLAAALTAVLVQDVRPVLLREDGIIEMASVLLLAAVVIGAVAAFSLWGVRAPLLVAGLIALSELLDETSFGARLFGFKPPELYGGGELDGFHDLLMLVYRLLHEIQPFIAWMLVLLLLASSAGVMLFALRQVSKGLIGAASWLADHVLIFFHIGFIGLAQVIDIATDSRALSAVEEMLEFNAALLLVFYVAQQAYNLRSGSTAAKMTSDARGE